jgi:CotH kinase protein/Secretion system C-terminal sorting domain
MKKIQFSVLLCLGLICELSAQPFTSSNLPIVVINTNGQAVVDEPKITADMGIINNAPGLRNTITDAFNDYNGNIAIEIRGSSSQSFPKKQYSVELRNSVGASIDASLLGLPPKDDWILFAPYNDKSLMRDALAYHLGRSLGRYASRVKYCELVLNGHYQGIYILLEKIKRDKNRVDINKLDPTEITGDNVTGGYILKVDKSTGNGGEGWNSSIAPPNRSDNQTIYFQYEYPKGTSIAAEQKAYIKKYVDDFETALAGLNFKDNSVGYAKYIDTDSFVDFFIMNEVSKNADGYRLSTYLHKKKDSDGGKLFMGPIWDFNLGFGNVNYCTQGNPEGFVYNFNQICPGDYWLIPFWWSRLLEDPAFKNKVAIRWAGLRNGIFKTTTVLSYLDSVSMVLNVESQQRNFQKWPVLDQYVWPNYFVGQTYQQEVDWLKNWVSQRLIWLDQNMPVAITAIDPIRFTAQVYPNPTKGNVVSEVEVNSDGLLRMELINSLGVNVYNVTNWVSSGRHVIALDISALGSGIYFLKTTFNDSAKSDRILLSR